jgi:hypothetical protein
MPWTRTATFLIRSRIRAVLSRPGRSSRPGRPPSGSASVHFRPAPLLATALVSKFSSRDPLLAKYAQAVGQRRSPGLVITARPSGSARVGSRSGQPWWSAITDPATSSRTNPGAITDRALVPVDLGKQSAVVQECLRVSVVNCHAANHAMVVRCGPTAPEAVDTTWNSGARLGGIVTLGFRRYHRNGHTAYSRPQ